jgi:hypothetical protein
MAKSTKNTKKDEDFIGWGGAATVNLVPFGGFIYLFGCAVGQISKCCEVCGKNRGF